MTETRTDRHSAGSTAEPVQALVRRRHMFLLCLLLAAVAALAVTLWQKPRYQTHACVEVVSIPSGLSAQPQAEAGAAYADEWSTGSQAYLRRQSELAGSRKVLRRAADRLRTSGRAGMGLGHVAERLSEHVEIIPVPGTALIKIVGKATQPTWAADIANEVAGAFVEVATAARHTNDARLEERLRDQLARCEEHLAGRRQALERMRCEHVIAGKRAGRAELDRRMEAIEQKLTHVQLSRLELETTRQVQAREPSEMPDGLALYSSTAPQEPVFQQLQSTLATLRRDQAKMEQVYLDGHPALQALRAEIAALEKCVADQQQLALQQARQMIEAKISAANQQEQALTSLLQEQRALAVEIAAGEPCYEILLAEVAQAEQLRSGYAAQLVQMTLHSEPQASAVVVSEAAEPPLKPAGLGKPERAGLILLAGLVLGLMLVLRGEKSTCRGANDLTPGRACSASNPAEGVLWQVELAPSNRDQTSSSEQGEQATASQRGMVQNQHRQEQCAGA